MRVTISFPPSVNHYYRMARGHMVISGEGRKYGKIVENELLMQRARPINGAPSLRITATLHSGNYHAYDIDNRAKSMLDALAKAGLFTNDVQVDDLRLIRGDVRPNAGCAEVDIDVI